MSDRKPATAARTLERSVTEAAWKSFGQLGERMTRSCAGLNDRNREWERDESWPGLSDETVELTTLVDLLHTCGNMQLNKVLLVLGQLVQEMDFLSETAVTDFVPAIALYGSDRDPDQRQGDLPALLPLLFDLLCFGTRCCDVAGNLIRQLEALTGEWNKSEQVDVNGIRFDCVLQSLSHLSVSLLTLDQVIAGNESLKQDLVSYKRTAELAAQDCNQFGIPAEESVKLSLLKQVCSLIEAQVMDNKSLFSQLTDAMCSASDNLVRNSSLCEQFCSFIRTSLQECEQQQQSLASKQGDNKWLAAACIFVHYVWLFRKEDRRLLKSLIECAKKKNLMTCHLPGNMTLLPDQFLSSVLPKGMCDKRLMDSLAAQRESLRMGQSLQRTFRTTKHKLLIWLLAFERSFGSDPDLSVSIVTRLTGQLQLLQEAEELVHGVRDEVRTAIHSHLQSGTPVSKQDMLLICRLIILLKWMDAALRRHRPAILTFLTQSAQYNAYVALKGLNGMKKRLVGEVKKYSEKKLDTISAVILSSNCLTGACRTPGRQLISFLCLSLVTPCMNDEELMSILPAVSRITDSCTLIQRIRQSTDCDFLHFQLDAVLPVFFSGVQEVSELRYFLLAMDDCESLVRSAFAYDEERQKYECDKLQEKVFSAFQSAYLQPLCRDLETELRLQTHADLQLEDQSPFKRRVRDFAAPLSSPPIRLSDRCLTHIAQQASSHLSEMSYNLTTIALHDWKTYERMLRTARTVYGLSFVQTQLPTQTVEQGLDVLSIARSMHSFVQRYAYNLNNQIFVETVSSNKHLNVLFIRHVANSIQTHGHGVLNTAVNLTYQFVRQQLNLLSQFLYEEHLKSRLVRDVRMYKESKGEYFPYERAERLVKGIRKLGITSEGLSLLDQVRILLTQVGNALGFVRMLRSGALHCSSASVHFIPDVDDLPDTSFHNLCVNEGFDGEVLRAADNLDSVLKQLNRNFSTATDYLQLLVTVFGDTLREQKHAHINNLFALVPALSISFVEHAILSKEKMNRKNAAGAAFTDDGFAVGVAYVLSLLHQVHDFQSLHWFRSVRCKIAEERNAVTSDSATDQRFAHTTSLTLKRLSVLQSEFDLLEYNLTCCRILFRS